MGRPSELPVETKSEGHKCGKEDGPEVKMPLDEKGVSLVQRRIVFVFQPKGDQQTNRI